MRSVFSLRREEERVSILQPRAVVSGVRLRGTKGRLCNFCFDFLFCEHVRALPLAAAVAVLPFSDLGDEVAVVIADPVRM